jgi:hypothetical protein
MTNNKYAKVEGHPNLLRDLSSNAIINTDTLSFNQYNLNKQKRASEKQRIDKIEFELNDLKSSIEEIKSLLKGIVNGS